MMRLITIIAALGLIASCSGDLGTNEQQEAAIAQMPAQSSVVRAPKNVCGQMPPINKEKLLLMLRKSNKITPEMTDSDQLQVLMAYLKEKRQRFSKSCK